MNQLTELFTRIYNIISFYDVENAKDIKEKEFTILINRYVFIVSIFFFLQSISNYLFFGYTHEALFNFIIFFVFSTSYFLLKKQRKNKIVIYLVFFCLNFIIMYYSSNCGLESGIFLFYFPLLTALPLFFTSKDYIHLISLFIIIIFSLYISAYYNFTLFTRDKNLNGYEHRLLLLSITSVIIFLMLNFFYLEEKRKSYYFILRRNQIRKQHIQQLSQELNQYKTLVNKNDLSEEDIQDILNSIRLNDAFFIEKFEKIFPNYLENLQQNATQKLSISDLKYCGMIRLGLTTKQIAIYTNSTIKAVEGKKYRLRKKLSEIIQKENYLL